MVIHTSFKKVNSYASGVSFSKSKQNICFVLFCLFLTGSHVDLITSVWFDGLGSTFVCVLFFCTCILKMVLSSMELSNLFMSWVVVVLYGSVFLFCITLKGKQVSIARYFVKCLVFFTPKHVNRFYLWLVIGGYISVVSSSPIKGTRCFLEQETLL